MTVEGSKFLLRESDDVDLWLLSRFLLPREAWVVDDFFADALDVTDCEAMR